MRHQSPILSLIRQPILRHQSPTLSLIRQVILRHQSPTLSLIRQAILRHQEEKHKEEVMQKQVILTQQRSAFLSSEKQPSPAVIMLTQERSFNSGGSFGSV